MPYSLRLEQTIQSEREPQRPFLEVLKGPSVGLFPPHIPDSDRSISSLCPAHTPLSWQTLNPTLYSCLCFPSPALAPSSMLIVIQAHLHRRTHTHTKLHTATHTHHRHTYTGTYVEVTNTDPQKSRQKYREANLLTNPHVSRRVYMRTQSHTGVQTQGGTHKHVRIEEDMDINTGKRMLCSHPGNPAVSPSCWCARKATGDILRPTHTSRAPSYPLNHEVLSCLSLYSSGKRELLISKKWSQGSMLTRAVALANFDVLSSHTALFTQLLLLRGPKRHHLSAPPE